MPAPHFSFVVPVLNGSTLVLQFAQNLFGSCLPYGGYEIVFVDNGSDKHTQDILEMLRTHYTPNVQVVRNPTNEGFGPANNKGAEHAQADVLVFTQTDVVFRGDVLSILRTAVGERPRALYGPRLLDYDTGWNTFNGVVVPYLEGWFLACTKGTWKEIGGFDPIYVPADFEDIDLAYVAQRKGISLVPLDLPVRHERAGSAGWSQLPAGTREGVTIRNRERFREKWSL